MYSAQASNEGLAFTVRCSVNQVAAINPQAETELLTPVRVNFAALRSANTAFRLKSPTNMLDTPVA